MWVVLHVVLLVVLRLALRLVLLVVLLAILRWSTTLWWYDVYGDIGVAGAAS